MKRIVIFASGSGTNAENLIKFLLLDTILLINEKKIFRSKYKK